MLSEFSDDPNKDLMDSTRAQTIHGPRGPAESRLVDDWQMMDSTRPCAVESQCFGTVGPVNSGFGGGGGVFGYVLGGSWGGWRWHGNAHQGLLQGFEGDLVWG